MTVSGVSVGEITKVTLDDGRAVVTMDIERDKLPAVYRDATMLLRPKTGLKDMSIALEPGTAKAGKLDEDHILPVGRTTPDVNPDEVLATEDEHEDGGVLEDMAGHVKAAPHVAGVNDESDPHYDPADPETSPSIEPPDDRPAP